MTRRKKVLATGCPRSGTRWLAAALCGAGLDVVHEGMGKDGAVSNYLATDVKHYEPTHSGVRSDFDFDVVLHLVRHPLAFVRSAHAHLGEGYWRWVTKLVPLDLTFTDDHRLRDSWEGVAEFWVRWNRFVEERPVDLVVRIEDVEALWPKMMELLGTQSTAFPASLKVVGHEPRRLDGTRAVEWYMLGDQKPEARAMARKYGYEVD